MSGIRGEQPNLFAQRCSSIASLRSRGLLNELEVKMKRVDVVKKPDGWAGQSGGRTVPNTKASTKAEAVKKVTAAAKKSSQPVSVRIHKSDGKPKKSAPIRVRQTRARARAKSQRRTAGRPAA